MRNLFISYVAQWSDMKSAPLFGNEILTGDDLEFNSKDVIKQFEDVVKRRMKAKHVTVLYFKFMEV